MALWKVSGTDREVGAIGVMEPFEIWVEALMDGTGLRELARSKRYTAGREHVLIESVVLSCDHPRHLRCAPTQGADEFCARCGHTWVGSWARMLAAAGEARF